MAIAKGMFCVYFQVFFNHFKFNSSKLSFDLFFLPLSKAFGIKEFASPVRPLVLGNRFLVWDYLSFINTSEALSRGSLFIV